MRRTVRKPGGSGFVDGDIQVRFNGIESECHGKRNFGIVGFAFDVQLESKRNSFGNQMTPGRC